MVLKGVILDNFYFGRHCGLERTEFQQFPLGEDVVVLKTLVLDVLLFWESLVS